MAVTRPSLNPEAASRITIPKLNRDPIQSLCPYSVLVNVHGYRVEIPPLPAADWLAVLMVPDVDLEGIFPGLLNDQDNDLVEELILSGDLNLDEYEEIILAVLETASARNWWVAIRLIEYARVSWDVLGAELGLRGVDATQVSLSSWLDVLLLMAIRSMDEKDVQMFMLKLEAPPPDTEVSEESEPEISAAQFMSMAG